MKTGIKTRSSKLCSLSDVRRALANVINQHRTGKLDDNKAKAQGYLLTALSKVIHQIVDETRLTELEAQVAEIQAANAKRGCFK